MCDLEGIGVSSMLRLTRITVSLTNRWSTLDFGFDLGVERRVEEMEHVLVCFRKINS